MDKENREKLNEGEMLKKEEFKECTIDSESIDDDYEDYSKLKKKNMIISIVVILLVGITATIFWTKGYEIVNFVYDIISKEDIIEENEEKNSEVVAINKIDLMPIYDKVHMMVNTIIIAEDGNIWGTQDITKELISITVEELNGPDDYLSAELKKWLDLDFSNGVEIHNYVWKKLGGTVGKAKELNVKAIETTINKLSE